jgi:hypothetical protein
MKHRGHHGPHWRNQRFDAPTQSTESRLQEHFAGQRGTASKRARDADRERDNKRSTARDRDRENCFAFVDATCTWLKTKQEPNEQQMNEFCTSAVTCLRHWDVRGFKNNSNLFYKDTRTERERDKQRSETGRTVLRLWVQHVQGSKNRNQTSNK